MSAADIATALRSVGMFRAARAIEADATRLPTIVHRVTRAAYGVLSRRKTAEAFNVRRAKNVVDALTFAGAGRLTRRAR